MSRGVDRNRTMYVYVLSVQKRECVHNAHTYISIQVLECFVFISK